MNRTAIIAGGAGIVVGYLAGLFVAEEKAKQKYNEATASYRRALDMTRRVPAEAPAQEESELMVVGGDIEKVNTNDFEGGPKYEPSKVNPYHTSIHDAQETSFEQFVSGGVNDYGVSYIEEEEYLDEEDGRFKGQITVVFGDGDPAFFMDGVEIDDWDKRLGDSILVDFARLVPPGINQVLYVRNHNTDEDYEVIRELP